MANPGRRRLRQSYFRSEFGQLYADLHGTPVVFDLLPLQYPIKVEQMVDTVGFIGCDFNPCFHDELIFIGEPLNQLAWETDPLNPSDRVLYTFTGGQGLMVMDLIDICRNLEPPFDDNDLDDFSAQAEHHFKTAVDDTHSILNFILELIQMCEGNIDKLRKLADKFRRAMKAFDELYKKTGNYWLSWNFAIKPFVRDYQAIFESLKKAMKRFRWLQTRNNLDTKVKYRQSAWKRENVITDGHPILWPASSGTQYLVPLDCHFEIDYNISVVPSSWAWVRFSIPQYLLSDEKLGLGTVWAALAGLYNPFKVAWEAVPFSWLIDWFVSRRTQLQLEATSLSPLKDAEILGTGYSLKTEVTGIVTFIGPPLYAGSSEPQRIEVGRFKYEQYRRAAGLPSPEVSPFRIPVKWYNFSIISALLQQKRRRG